MASVSPMNIIRVASLSIHSCIDEALRAELDNAAAGADSFEEVALDHPPPHPNTPDHPPPHSNTLDPRPGSQASLPCSLAGGAISSRGPREGGVKKNADKARRQRKRALKKITQPGRPRLSKSNGYSIPTGISVSFDAQHLSAAKGAFVSLKQPCNGARERSLEELVEGGFRVVEWDGSTPTAILDKEDRIFAFLAGRPDCPDWDEMHRHISALLNEAGAGAQPGRKERRGNFVALSTGVSYGGGQQVPGNLVHSKTNRAVLDRLTGDAAVQRVAGFMNSCFASYAPKLYGEYAAHLQPLFKHDERLTRVFSQSIFPTCTFNCGPRVVTLEHVDNTNVPFGLCGIFACGSYNPIRGGHIILFNLRLVIQFPPGSTIFVPSGTIRHGNVGIEAHETRQSFTQYCPGGLFRWVDYGFMPVKSSPEEVQQEFRETHDARCKRAVGLFSKIHELEQDRRGVFNLRGSD